MGLLCIPSSQFTHSLGAMTGWTKGTLLTRPKGQCLDGERVTNIRKGQAWREHLFILLRVLDPTSTGIQYSKFILKLYIVNELQFIYQSHKGNR